MEINTLFMFAILSVYVLEAIEMAGLQLLMDIAAKIIKLRLLIFIFFIIVLLNDDLGNFYALFQTYRNAMNNKNTLSLYGTFGL
jgi:hypothetical protein